MFVKHSRRRNAALNFVSPVLFDYFNCGYSHYLDDACRCAPCVMQTTDLSLKLANENWFFPFFVWFFVRSFVRARSLETDSQKICGPSACKFFALNFFFLRGRRTCSVKAKRSENSQKIYRKRSKNGLKTVWNCPKTIRNGPKRSEMVRNPVAEPTLLSANFNEKSLQHEWFSSYQRGV